MRRNLLVLALAAAAAGAGCNKADPPAPAPSGPPLASKAYYRVDARPPAPCARDTTCTAQLVLAALGDYHVNERYPVKFIADPRPGVELDGTGTFSVDSAKYGTLTLRYKLAAAGTARITGKLKLSVCTEENCQIEEPTIAFDVTAS